MRIIAFTASLFFAALFAGPAPAQDIKQQIADNCSREWGLNYSMIEHCRTRQIEAVREFVTTGDGEATADPYRMLLTNCYAEWTKRTGTNWPLVMHCYNRQVEAYERLQRQ